MIALITHAVFYEKGEIYGPADAVSNYLKEKQIDHFYLKHPLWGNHQSKLFTIKHRRQSMKLLGPRVAGLVRYPVDVFLSVRTFWKFKKPTILIGVDPLNCIGGVVLQKLGRCNKLVYFTADFADVRFPNPVLNAIYHALDTICATQADYCWSVSTRILSFRKKQGVPDERNLLIPNAPAYTKIKRQPISHVDMYRLVIVSNLQAGVEFDAIFKAIKQLLTKYPKLSLSIIGGGEGEPEVQKAIDQHSISNRVVILGRLPHEKVHQILAQSGVGIALYNDTASWRYYSDSMKARDYMACGLPVLISGNLATVDDIVKGGAGLAIKPTVKNIVSAIEKIIHNKESYEQYRKNALALAKTNDIEKILENAFKKLSLDIPAGSS